MEFRKHYTVDEARALLPDVRKWLKQLGDLRPQLEGFDQQVVSLLALQLDVGGPLVNSWVRVIAQIKCLLFEFERRQIQIKDLDRGLIDFPAFLGEKEVFLCWEKGEADIEFWHELHTGYAGRKPLGQTSDEQGPGLSI